MREELLKFFGPQQETVYLAGEPYTVKTISDEDDLTPFKDIDKRDWLYVFTVRCTFDKDGNRAFTDDDVQVLRKAPSIVMLQLVKAVERVNGLGAEEQVKNSEAVPSGG